MGRYTGPQSKQSRREGADLFGTGGEGLRRRIEQPPGMHGTRMRRGRPSDFQRQLREKQKVKRAYGMRERQFRRFVLLARREEEMTGAALLKLLERRLDSVLYKGGLARTRRMARQMIVHGHVRVNDQRVTVPSYLCQPGSEVTLDPKAAKMPDVNWAMEAPSLTLPSWLARSGATISMIDWPTRDEVEFPIDENLIVEFYSR